MANNVFVVQGPHRSTRQRDGWQSSQRSGAEYHYKIRIYQNTQSYLYHVAAEEAKQKWQAEWITSHKTAATKQYFPSVRDRLGTKLTLTAKLEAVLTGHGKTRAYLYRFTLRDDARRTCGQNNQTVNHLLFQWEKTRTQREVLKHQISQQRNRMEIKQELISKHKKVFCEFIGPIDFELLQQNEQQIDLRTHSV